MNKLRLLLIVGVVMVLTGCRNESKGQTQKIPEPETEIIVENRPTKEKKITILAAGDNLIHDTIYMQAAKRAGGDGFDFSFDYEGIAEQVAKADIAVLNQETPLASDAFPLSNYPRFNSPNQVGEHMVKIGFDVFNHANNHIYDVGEEGLKATMDFWDTQDGVIAVGAFRDEAEKEEIKYIERNGIKVAFLGYAEHTNGLNLPQNSSEGIIKTSQQDFIQKQIQRAKNEFDLVVVSVHWGDEGSNIVNESQKELAQKMVDWGADFIIGTHPHVLQGGEFLERQDGTKGYVFYSLGNFISAQNRAENMASGMLEVDFIRKDKNSKPRITGVRFTPTVTHFGYGKSDIRIIPFDKYTQELASHHGVREIYPTFGYDFIKDIFDKISLENITN